MSDVIKTDAFMSDSIYKYIKVVTYVRLQYFPFEPALSDLIMSKANALTRPVISTPPLKNDRVSSLRGLFQTGDHPLSLMLAHSNHNYADIRQTRREGVKIIGEQWDNIVMNRANE